MVDGPRHEALVTGATPSEKEQLKQIVEKSAVILCEDILSAAETAEIALRLTVSAQRKASSVTQTTMFGRLPYKLRVGIEPGTEAFVSEDDRVVDGEPSEFIATEVRSIGEHGVEFYNGDNDRWLKIRGFQFDVSPVFDTEPALPEQPLQ